MMEVLYISSPRFISADAAVCCSLRRRESTGCASPERGPPESRGREGNDRAHKAEGDARRPIPRPTRRYCCCAAGRERGHHAHGMGPAPPGNSISKRGRRGSVRPLVRPASVPSPVFSPLFSLLLSFPLRLLSAASALCALVWGRGSVAAVRSRRCRLRPSTGARASPGRPTAAPCKIVEVQWTRWCVRTERSERPTPQNCALSNVTSWRDWRAPKERT